MSRTPHHGIAYGSRSRETSALGASRTAADVLRTRRPFTVILSGVVITISLGATSVATDSPLSSERREALLVQWRATIRDATNTLATRPNDTNALSRRGDAFFFSGEFGKAVDDYSAMVAADPNVDTSHWRRGIAYFYAERYADAAAQFQRYHAFDDVDRENGIWRYLSQVKAVGKAKAQAELLKYAKDDREPFPAVYELFAGRTTPEQIFAQIEKAEIDAAEREKRLFYAHLYVGLNEVIENRPDAAHLHLVQAVQNSWAPKAGYGPHYMWQVGRLQEQLLRKGKDRPQQ